MSWFRRLLGSDAGRDRARAGNNELDALERAVGNRRRDDAAVLKKVRKAARDYPQDPEIALLAAGFYYSVGMYTESRAAYRLSANGEDPAYALTMIAASHVEQGDLDAAHEQLIDAQTADPASPDFSFWQGVLHDLDGRNKAAMACYRRAALADPDEYFVPPRLSEKEFQGLVHKVFRKLEKKYEGFGQDLQGRNVDVQVQSTPTRAQIEDDDFHPLWLGVFEGATAVERSIEDPWSAMPGRIILFQRNLERDCRNLKELAQQVEITLLHEVAHAHGREEDWMEDRGLA